METGSSFPCSQQPATGSYPKPDESTSHTLLSNLFKIHYHSTGVRVPVEARFFSSPLGLTQPPMQQVQGALSSGIKRLRREAGHSHTTSADVNNTWNSIVTLP
jgi:hypothetical protein